MVERLDVLRARLPESVISIIQLYDSHLLADLIKEVGFIPCPAYSCYSAGLLLQLEEPTCFTPASRELKRRLQHNRTRHLHGGCWLPVFFFNHAWRLTFDRWKYETVQDLDYLPDWVKEDYIASKPPPSNSGGRISRLLNLDGLRLRPSSSVALQPARSNTRRPSKKILGA